MHDVASSLDANMISIDEFRHCELFAGLGDQDLAEIAAIAYKETYATGDLICAERELANQIFILCQGRVQVHIQLRSSLEPDGEMIIEEVEPGRIFGWSSLVKQRRFTASARALEPATVLIIDADDLNTLFDRNLHIGFVVMKQLAEVIASRLRHTREVCAPETGET
jgi:CRP/FNR family cyclic AMP-dependent transcriptional regulator